MEAKSHWHVIITPQKTLGHSVFKQKILKTYTLCEMVFLVMEHNEIMYPSQLKNFAHIPTWHKNIHKKKSNGQIFF